MNRKLFLLTLIVLLPFLFVAFHEPASANSMPGPAWRMGGNGTPPPGQTPFLGISGYPLVFKTDNVVRAHIEVDGDIGLGTANPDAKVEISKVLDPNSEERLLVLDSHNGGVNAGSSIQFKNHGAGYFAAIAGIDDSDYDGRLEFRVSNNGFANSSELTSADNAMVITQDGHVEVDHGYIKLATTSGMPPAADCDAADEIGRMKVDDSSTTLWVCTASGWVGK